MLCLVLVQTNAEDIGVKLQGDDSRKGEKHRSLPVEGKGSLRGSQTNKECTERHDGVGALGREARLQSTNNPFI